MRRLSLVAVTVTMALTGCFDALTEPGPDDADATAGDGPAWRAGYRWVYTVDESYAFDGGNETGDGSRRTRTTVEVVNIDTRVDGVPAFHVRVATDGGGGSLGSAGLAFPPRDGLWAYTQDDLAAIGYAWDTDVPQVGADVGDCGGGSAAWGAAYLQVPEAGDGFRFPLKPGDGWSYQVGDGDGSATVEARLGDPETVETEAGSFATVPVRYSVSRPEGLPDGGAGTFTETATYWWSAEAQHVVRYEAALEASWAEADEATGMTWSRVVELATVSLEPGASEAVPDTVGAEAPGWSVPAVEHVRYEIVTDTPFPVNATGGPVTATFGLVELTDGEDAFWPGPPRGVADVAAVAATLPQGATATWNLEAWGDATPLAHVEGRATTFTHTFDGVAEAVLTARVDDPCRIGWPVVDADVVASWHSVHEVAVAPASEPIDVTEVRTGAANQMFFVEWSFDRVDTGLPGDGGDVVFTHASGEEVRVPTNGETFGGGDAYLWASGKWTVTWEPRGPPPLDGVVGDDVTLRLLAGPVP